MDIRKTMMIKESTEADSFGKAWDPIIRVAAVAVIQNPFAGASSRIYHLFSTSAANLAKN